jgi:hypothetical protein
MLWLKTSKIRGDSKSERDKIRDLWGSAIAVRLLETKTQELIGQVVWVGKESHNILKESLKSVEIILKWVSEKYFLNSGPEEKRLIFQSKEGFLCHKRFRFLSY